ncbi:MAG: peptidase M14 [Planctomycetes bacterium]|nr:peptidase M14 [Planctomycetota bacterium]
MKKLSTALLLTALAVDAHAQADRTHQLDIAWNRLYDYEGITKLAERIQQTWPDRVSLQSIGKSYEGRDMWMLVVNEPATGDDRSKPAFYSDANVHGNEVQGAETNLYLVWYLCEHYEELEQVRDLVDRVAFYVLLTVNPDGRAAWFREANTASSQRAPRKPFDDDHDGEFDEDPYDDLDGDGHITWMRKKVERGTGTHKEHPDWPGLMVRVAPGEDDGDWVLLGAEGIDNDGDGRFNEDGPGYYDMNRNWPSSWNPNHLQGGAGEYPLSHPETRAIAEFILDHPNIAGVQSFHNAGGMILRGPGLAEYGQYPRQDSRVYDAIGEEGEFMLPFYRYMIIHKDLYSVAGGFVNWTAEGLGIFSFTNEMWSNKRMRQGDAPMSDVDRRRWDDRMTFGENYVAWKPYDHPFYGEIEIGGAKKMTGRVPPTWLIEEEAHRNAAFVAYHAGQMPDVELVDLEVESAPGGMHYVDVTARNSKLIPTRSQIAAEHAIGMPDRLTLRGDGIRVIAGGKPVDRWRPERIDFVERDPATQRGETGVPSRGDWTVRWVVAGSGAFTIDFESEKATNRTIRGSID